ncbi:LPS export ABC transporter ATP-binding protein [bacterium]|nr:LPS export ABC transporter ATP-binding protein [bacterium]
MEGKEIRAEGLVKKYGRRTVVKGVSLHVPMGRVTGLLGPNGAGKTTTFYMITGLVKPNKGSVFAGEKNISRLPVYKRARLGLGYLDQSPSVFRRLTVAENIALVLEIHGVPHKARAERVDALMVEMGVQDLSESHGYALSGGERRRVEIARALAADPEFLLLDEPFTGVDPKHIQQLQDIIVALKDERGLGILITDHNVRDTMGISDWVYLMNEGEIEVEGSPETVRTHPRAREVYLGDRFDSET